ncbi:MAG: undecaprenyl-phosphate glucose phosphotransferase [Bacteroidota bacterium]|nr:undecaprenyl-phosphate glucose phosphotransferase [Bacteroidota bacterium]
MTVNKRSIYYFRLFIDLLLLNAIFLLAAVEAQSFKILLTHSKMFILEALLNLSWYFTTNVFGFYEDNNKFFSFHFIDLIKNVLGQLLISILFIFLLKEDLFTRNFIIYYTFILTFLISLRIILFRKVLKTLRKKGLNVRNIIIIGAGSVGNSFKSMIDSNIQFGYKFIGYIDDFKTGPDILGKTNILDNVLTNHKIDEMIIALPDSAFNLLDNIIRIANKNAVKIHIIPDYFRFMSKKFEISMVGNFPVISVRSEPLDEIHWRIVKRFSDIIFAILVSALLIWWLFPLIGIIIKLTSRGPVFFVQKRVGVHNKTFNCYKFRTMHTAKGKGNKFTPVTEEGDTRITNFGKFLRKSNLDELPQFINVLLGNMSVVGPRPHALAYHEKYGKIVEEIKMRHNVKPGITGWAQIHGLRGDVKDEKENIIRTQKRIEHDLWYIQNWTIWLDLQIVLLTVWQMIKGDTKGM